MIGFGGYGRPERWIASLTDAVIQGEDEIPMYNFKTVDKGKTYDGESIRAKAVFHDLEGELIEFIESAPVLVGCVAWLTSRPVLRALASRRQGVSIVVQKEDFLRPDIGVQDRNGWQRELRSLYEALHSIGGRGWIKDPVLPRLSYCNDPTIEPVRCVGVRNVKGKTTPLMHHKFLVACGVGIEDDDYGSTRTVLNPTEVWTGSFNPTKNATGSFENAIVVKSEPIAKAYLREWSQILALSEPLDWESEWCAPQWRIGS